EKGEAAKADGASPGPIAGLTKEAFRECLVAAGKQRMLPIFLTTATTIGGLLPLAFSGGPLWEGMSWLMVYGLRMHVPISMCSVAPATAVRMTGALRRNRSLLTQN
ncbi:MAG: hypothetical protein AAGK74_06685, partial [Chloroflexota bacterium]